MLEGCQPMIWVFLVLSLCAVAYSAYIVMEHVRESGIVDADIQQRRAEVRSLETSIQVGRNHCEQAKDRVVEREREVEELQTRVEALLSEVESKRKDMERRGRFRVDG